MSSCHCHCRFTVCLGISNAASLKDSDERSTCYVSLLSSVQRRPRIPCRSHGQIVIRDLSIEGSISASRSNLSTCGNWSSLGWWRWPSTKWTTSWIPFLYGKIPSKKNKKKFSIIDIELFLNEKLCKFSKNFSNLAFVSSPTRPSVLSWPVTSCRLAQEGRYTNVCQFMSILLNAPSLNAPHFCALQSKEEFWSSMMHIWWLIYATLLFLSFPLPYYGHKSLNPHQRLTTDRV